MSRSGFNNEDFLNLIITYGECDKIVDRKCRVYRNKYPNRPRATRSILNNFIKELPFIWNISTKGYKGEAGCEQRKHANFNIGVFCSTSTQFFI